MKKSWTNHCKTAEEKERFKIRLQNSIDIFDVLRNMLMDKYEYTCKERRSLKSYLTQDWKAYQADRNATERTLLEIMELLPTLEKNDD